MRGKLLLLVLCLFVPETKGHATPLLHHIFPGTSDDYYRWDPLIAFQPPKEGDYTVFYHDLNFRGDQNAVYRLTLGVVPHAIGIFPLGGQRGKTVNVQFTGPNLKEATQQVSVPPDSPDRLDVAYLSAIGATNARPFQDYHVRSF